MEAAGLAIGVMGIASLFTTCIEAFDIVIRAREFGREFDLLCTQLSLQRVRLLLWGETIGLASELPSAKSPYYHRLENDDKIAPAIESTLHHLRSLLQTADLITDRYSTQPGSSTEYVQVEPSKGLTIFRDRFDAFKSRIRRNNDAKSPWTVTRWAVHDLGKFREVITSIKDLIDGLEGITSAVGLLLERQHALLTREVEAICDTESLHLLQRAVAETSQTDERSPSLKFLSDAASHRLSIISDSRLTGLLYSNLSTRASSIRSYRTALSHRFDASSIPSLVEELDEDEVSILTGVPSLSEEDVDDPEVQANGPGEPFGNQIARLSAETHTRAQQIIMTKPQTTTPTPPPSPETVPQNQRLIADLIRKSQTQPHTPTTPRAPPDLPFSPDCSSTYGNVLAPHKETDASRWSSQSTNFLIHADKGNLSARRIFLELRSIQSAAIPFISAAPLSDGSLDKLIARIEGPPGTPYEGGIFWLLVSFASPSWSSGTDLGPPSLKFLTKIFHPNIDCQGNICGGGNYSEWWNDLEQIGTNSTSSSRQPTGPWFSSKKSNWFSLGALLTALCGLLATPNVEDPLVVEIAETYLRDYEAYCAAARLYTERYAGREMRPVGFGELGESWEDWGCGDKEVEAAKRSGEAPPTLGCDGGDVSLDMKPVERHSRSVSNLRTRKGESEDRASMVPTLLYTTTTMTTSTIQTESVTTSRHRRILVPEFLKRSTKSKESLVTRYFSPRRRRVGKGALSDK